MPISICFKLLKPAAEMMVFAADFNVSKLLPGQLIAEMDEFAGITIGG